MLSPFLNTSLPSGIIISPFLTIAAFDSVKEKYGSVYNYIIKGLKISPNDIEALKEKYLEQA